MSNHPNRGWRKRWTVDPSTCTATHEPTGLVVTFRKASDGEWEGESGNIQTLDPNDMMGVARLLREAGEIYKEHLDKRQ